MPDHKELKKICSRTIVLARSVGKFMRSEQKKILSSDIEVKSTNSFVTYVDKESERRIARGLKKIFPAAGFITEEGTQKKSRSEFMWIIDPLDGTTNFIHGLPCYCISIALYTSPPNPLSPGRGGRGMGGVGGEVLVGVIHDPNTGETFHAVRGQGAFINGKRIAVTSRRRLKNSLLVTGFPTYNYSRMDEYLKLFRSLMKKTRGLRRLGSAALDLAYVACGRFEAFYEYSLNPWDVAAGALIVEEAGGSLSDFKGGQNWLFGKEIIASNDHTHKELLTECKRFFG